MIDGIFAFFQLLFEAPKLLLGLLAIVIVCGIVYSCTHEQPPKPPSPPPITAEKVGEKSRSFARDFIKGWKKEGGK